MFDDLQPPRRKESQPTGHTQSSSASESPFKRSVEGETAMLWTRLGAALAAPGTDPEAEVLKDWKGCGEGIAKLMTEWYGPEELLLQPADASAYGQHDISDDALTGAESPADLIKAFASLMWLPTERLTGGLHGGRGAVEGQLLQYTRMPTVRARPKLVMALLKGLASTTLLAEHQKLVWKNCDGVRLTANVLVEAGVSEQAMMGTDSGQRFLHGLILYAIHALREREARSLLAVESLQNLLAGWSPEKSRVRVLRLVQMRLVHELLRQMDRPATGQIPLSFQDQMSRRADLASGYLDLLTSVKMVPLDRQCLYERMAEYVALIRIEMETIQYPDTAKIAEGSALIQAWLGRVFPELTFKSSEGSESQDPTPAGPAVDRVDETAAPKTEPSQSHSKTTSLFPRLTLEGPEAFGYVGQNLQFCFAVSHCAPVWRSRSKGLPSWRKATEELFYTSASALAGLVVNTGRAQMVYRWLEVSQAVKRMPALAGLAGNADYCTVSEVDELLILWSVLHPACYFTASDDEREDLLGYASYAAGRLLELLIKRGTDPLEDGVANVINYSIALMQWLGENTQEIDNRVAARQVIARLSDWISSPIDDPAKTAPAKELPTEASGLRFKQQRFQELSRSYSEATSTSVPGVNGEKVIGLVALNLVRLRDDILPLSTPSKSIEWSDYVKWLAEYGINVNVMNYTTLLKQSIGVDRREVTSLSLYRECVEDAYRRFESLLKKLPGDEKFPSSMLFTDWRSFTDPGLGQKASQLDASESDSSDWSACGPPLGADQPLWDYYSPPKTTGAAKHAAVKTEPPNAEATQKTEQGDSLELSKLPFGKWLETADYDFLTSSHESP
jgi:hypothetical protein